MSDKMTWEETIKYIRDKAEYKLLVEKAYFEEELPLNIERFNGSEEFHETLALIQQYAPHGKSVLDVGSGNGISAISFALKGYNVTATEPDPSNTVGAGAIRILKKHYNLENLVVIEEFAENIDRKGELFDIIYVRQAMHHAYDLNQFILNLASLLKPDGILLTIRDHVVFDDKDKEWFLKSHPLQKFYGGENAFTEHEYLDAFKNAKLKVLKKLKYFDSPINYFPAKKTDFIKKLKDEQAYIDSLLSKKIGLLSKIPFVKSLYYKKNNFNPLDFFKEKEVAGRMYSFIVQK